MVYGFGEKKTPAPFVAACDKFIFTEVLRKGAETPGELKRKSPKDLNKDVKLIRLLRDAVEAASDESGWAHLGVVGHTIAKRTPEFDARNYGYAKLRGLIEATQRFEEEERPVGQGPHKDIYFRDKQANLLSSQLPSEIQMTCVKDLATW